MSDFLEKRTIKAILAGGFLSALLLCGLTSVAEAQQRGMIEGRVVDSAGVGIPGATVLVVGTSRGAAADIDGYYKIAGLHAGPYSLVVLSIGFEPDTSVVEVVVRPKETTRYSVSLTEAIDEDPMVVVFPHRRVIGTPPSKSLVDFVAEHRGDSLGTLRLHVRDEEGGAVPGAIVMLVGTSYGAVADTNGQVALEQFPVGTYTFRIESPNFSCRNVEISVRESDRALFELILPKRYLPEPETSYCLRIGREEPPFWIDSPLRTSDGRVLTLDYLFRY